MEVDQIHFLNQPDDLSMIRRAPSSGQLVLRFLDGRFAGVDFPLGRHGRCFCIGPSHACLVCDAGSTRTVFVPADCPRTTFSIEAPCLGETGDFILVSVRSGARRRECARFGHICHAGSWRFMVKPVDARSQAMYWPGWRRLRQGWFACLLLLLVCSVCAALALHPGPDESTTDALRAALSASALHVVIMAGRDRGSYVFACDEVEAAWVRQALARAGLESAWQVITARREKERLESWLASVQPALLTLRLDVLQHPVLVLDPERFRDGSVALGTLRRQLLSMMPYALSLSVEWHSTDSILRAARAELDAMSLAYQVRAHANHRALVLTGAPAESVRTRLRDFLERFERAYGTRRVQFMIVDDQSWLEVAGAARQPYRTELLNARHWYLRTGIP